jgi:hypothetical protein
VSLDNALWFAYIVVEAVLIGLISYRRFWRNFPVFFTYCVWDLSSNFAVYIISRSYSTQSNVYANSYLIQAAIDSVLQFGVLVELTWAVLRPLRASLSRVALVPISVLILILGAFIWPFAALPGPGVTHAERVVHILMQLQQTVTILRVCFFLALAGCSQWLSVGWQDRELQVATGLGFYSIVSLGVAMLNTHQSSQVQYRHLNEVVIGSYILSLVYWLYNFAQQEVARREFTPQMQNFLLAVAGAAHSSRVALTESRSEKTRKPGKP